MSDSDSDTSLDREIKILSKRRDALCKKLQNKEGVDYWMEQKEELMSEFRTVGEIKRFNEKMANLSGEKVDHMCIYDDIIEYLEYLEKKLEDTISRLECLLILRERREGNIDQSVCIYFKKKFF